MADNGTVIQGRTTTFSPADHPLTDDEVTRQFGDLFDRALVEISNDFDYLISMADNGRKIADRQAASSGQKRKPKREPLSDEIRARILALRDKGVTAQAIADMLNEEKITTAQGRPWSKGNLRLVVRNASRQRQDQD